MWIWAGYDRSSVSRLLAWVQQALVAAQGRDHAAHRPACRTCGAVCRIKDYRPRRIATLFGAVTIRLPRFQCAGCDEAQAGIGWPPHCRSTPEFDQLRAHLSALLPYRVAAGVLEQLLPVEAGTDPETLRARTLNMGLPHDDGVFTNQISVTFEAIQPLWGSHGPHAGSARPARPGSHSRC